jgi:hypothetical protein
LTPAWLILAYWASEVTGTPFYLSLTIPKEVREQGIERMATVCEQHPWIKAWVALGAACSLGLLVHAIEAHVDVLKQYGGWRLILAAAVFMAPVVALVQWQLFKDFAELDDVL